MDFLAPAECLLALASLKSLKEVDSLFAGVGEPMATNLMELSQVVMNTSEFRDHLHMILFDPQKNHPIN